MNGRIPVAFTRAGGATERYAAIVAATVVAAALAAALVVPTPAAAVAGTGVEQTARADVVKELSPLLPLTGGTWTGHYSLEEDAHYVHVLVVEPALGGRAVRATKRVDELDFEMETVYYWDAGVSAIAYLTLTNRGQLSRGAVVSDGDALELLGHEVTADGEIPYRYRFEVTENGSLEDRFYRKTDEGWDERHLIVYTRDITGVPGEETE